MSDEPEIVDTGFAPGSLVYYANTEGRGPAPDHISGPDVVIHSMRFPKRQPFHPTLWGNTYVVFQPVSGEGMGGMLDPKLVFRDLENAQAAYPTLPYKPSTR